jgi:glycosyltransferase involved in cell wall biosynthesis
MPVKNALPYLDAAVESILTQRFADFEFVIRDDHSTDGTLERLRFWADQDQRIRLIEGDRSLGPAGSSNFVVEEARAPIVARMDGDDISLPDRLHTQFHLLKEHQDTVLIGSVWQGIDRRGRVVRDPDLIALQTNRFAAPFAHGSIMFRRDAFFAAGGYRKQADFWEDLDLFVRIANLGRVLVSAKPLYQHRFSEASTRLTSGRERVEQAVDLMFRCRAMHRKRGDYTPLLFEPARDGRRDPNTLLSLDFITLWSGLRPRTLMRLLSRGALQANLDTVRALVWATWALISPGTLRYFMSERLRRNNRKAARELKDKAVCEWRVRRVPISLEGCPHFSASADSARA